MTDLNQTIEIDRIILTDLKLNPDQAQRIRKLVEFELSNLIQNRGLLLPSGSREISSLRLEGFDLSGSQGEVELARIIARGIEQSIVNL